MTYEDREAEVLALQKRALDPDDDYDGSDAMIHPEGDFDGNAEDEEVEGE